MPSNRQIQQKPAFFSVLFFFMLSGAVNAQDGLKENFLDQASVVTRVHYGFLLAHHPRIAHLVKHTSGFEISLSNQSTGRKLWQQYYGYPQTGYSYVFLDFNDPEQLGKAHALMAFLNLPIKRTGHFQLSFRMACGLGYVTKKFERVENHKNDVIGSHLNAAIQFNFETRYKLAPHLFFNFNIGLTHFSNGSFRTPNLGINNPSANTGFTWQLHPSKEFIKSEHPAPGKKWKVDVLYATGVKETTPATGKKYFSHTVSSTAIKPAGHKSKIGFGIDLFYDVSLLKEFSRRKKNFNSNSQVIRSGIHVDHELMTEKLSILFQMGAYWLDQYKADGTFYHRIGFKYLLNDHLFINLTLKTHFAKADYTECGLGWRFL